MKREETTGGYEHLIKTTDSAGKAIYKLAPNFNLDDLTGEERYVLGESYRYLRMFAPADERKNLKAAKEDFRLLSEIKGMPPEAMIIIQQWID